MDGFVGFVRRLADDALLYTSLLRAGLDVVRGCIELADTGEAVTVVVGDVVEVVEGCVDPDFKIPMDSGVFKKIFKGETDVFALSVKARAGETRPVEFELYSEDECVLEACRAFFTYLFVPGRIKVKSLTSELAGRAHGAHPIPLIYWDGFRSAWYLVRAGEVLNRESVTHPWPETFIILRGRGRAVVGDEKFDLKPGMVIYIPPNLVHQVWAEENVELIWMAWQVR
ncbi:MAG: hypothetical protein DRO00_07430 [Thermoproteota archaeon]|nr:MAG: hypothetical protein DRO00_07430 [Candidatus Korarchaeota archaeon]